MAVVAGGVVIRVRFRIQIADLAVQATARNAFDLRGKRVVVEAFIAAADAALLATVRIVAPGLFAHAAARITVVLLAESSGHDIASMFACLQPRPPRVSATERARPSLSNMKVQ